MRWVLHTLALLPACASASLAATQIPLPVHKPLPDPPPLQLAPAPFTAEEKAAATEYQKYFIMRVKSKIDMSQIHDLMLDADDMLISRTVKLMIRLGPTGELLSRRISASCGYAPLDGLMLEALDRAQPFAPPPAAFIASPDELDIAFGLWSLR